MNEISPPKREKPATRERLKTAARRLFAVRGFDGVTIRDILIEAGDKNGASIGYYFGSKEGLIYEIAVDIYGELDRRWTSALQELEDSGRSYGVRELIEILVESAMRDDGEAYPTINRVSDFFVHYRYHLVLGVTKAGNLKAFERILTLVRDNMPGVPDRIARQRLIFLMRYLSTVYALFESAQVSGTERQRVALRAPYDLVNLIDTAVGLVTAPVAAGGKPR